MEYREEEMAVPGEEALGFEILDAVADAAEADGYQVSDTLFEDARPGNDYGGPPVRLPGGDQKLRRRVEIYCNGGSDADMRLELDRWGSYEETVPVEVWADTPHRDAVEEFLAGFAA